MSCGTAIYLIGQMALITYLPLYLKDVMGFTPYWASQALALTQGGAMIGRVGWGVASDRIFGWPAQDRADHHRHLVGDALDRR